MTPNCRVARNFLVGKFKQAVGDCKQAVGDKILALGDPDFPATRIGISYIGDSGFVKRLKICVRMSSATLPGVR